MQRSILPYSPSLHAEKIIGRIFNKALESAGIEGPECICELVSDLSKVPENIRTAVRNNGGGHGNHTFFWSILSPNGGGEPSGKLADAIIPPPSRTGGRGGEPRGEKANS